MPTFTILPESFRPDLFRETMVANFKEASQSGGSREAS